MEKQEVALSKSDKEHLKNYVNKGKHSARAIKRAHVLLLLNDGATASVASDRAGVSLATVYNLKNRYQGQHGEISKVIEDKPRPGQPPKITPKVEAHITALACSQAPQGRREWSLRLLADKVVELGYVDEVLLAKWQNYTLSNYLLGIELVSDFFPAERSSDTAGICQYLRQT